MKFNDNLLSPYNMLPVLPRKHLDGTDQSTWTRGQAALGSVNGGYVTESCHDVDPILKKYIYVDTHNTTYTF